MNAWLVLWPAGLWALLTLLIPVLIHLFSRSRGRRVLIGNIDLVRKARLLRVTQVRLEQWILLALRLLIFTIAALVLAQLAIQGLTTIKGDVAYVTPGWLSASSLPEQEQILVDHPDGIWMLDSEFSDFLPDQATTRAIVRTETSQEAFWPYLAERLASTRHTGEVTVYADSLASSPGNHLAPLASPVTWSLRERQSINPLPAPAVLLLYDASRAADAAYLEAALESLRLQRLGGLTWQAASTSELDQLPNSPDWLIVLSADSVDTGWLTGPEAPQWVLEDMPGEGVAGAQRQAITPDWPFTRFTISRIGEAHTEGEPLWRMQDETELLSSIPRENGIHLRFNSRFEPGSSSLVQQAGFPQELMQLAGVDIPRTHTNLAYSAGQLPAPDSQATMHLPSRLLQPWLAALLALLWITERWLSERRRNARD